MTADDLVRKANDLMPLGEWRAAADALEDAAGLHAGAGQSADESRCLRFAAALRRYAGDPAGAIALADRAAAAAPDDPAMAMAADIQHAEAAAVDGRYAEADVFWTSAIDRADRQEVAATAADRGGLLCARADARISSGLVAAAASDFDRAHELLSTNGDVTAAHAVRVRQGIALLQLGYVAEAHAVSDTLDRVLAGVWEVSPHLLAEADVLAARVARANDDFETAAQRAEQARARALDAVAPVIYFAAAVEIAEGQQATGSLEGAYGTLATASATLGDLLGRDVARSWIEPCLLAYQARWGDASFAAAKESYEARRRAALSR